MTVQTLLMANNASSLLSGAITNTSTTANLTPGTGALFPQPTTNQYFKLTFTDAATQTLREIVHVTNVTTDTITMVRGQESTEALAWVANDFAVNLITAGTLQVMAQNEIVQSGGYNWGQDTGTANTYTCVFNPAITSLTDGMEITFKAANTNTGPSTLLGYPLISNAGVLQGGEVQANKNNKALWNQSSTCFYLTTNINGPTPVQNASQTDHAINLGQFLSANGLNLKTANNLSEIAAEGSVAQAAALVNLGAIGRFINLQIFSSSGSYTPTPGTNKIFVQGIGTGGNGAGSVASGSTGCSCCSGGASGGYAEAIYAAGFSSGITVTIGSIGAVNYGSGATGGASSFGSLMVIGGGGGGAAAAQASSVAYFENGGGAPGATPTLSGQISGIATRGEFGFGGKVFNGSAVSGLGASSQLGAGGGNIAIATSGSAGGNAFGYGAGGGGAGVAVSSPAVYGGNASTGLFKIWEFS